MVILQYSEIDNSKVESQIENENSDKVTIDAVVDEDANEVSVNMDSSLISKAAGNNMTLEVNTGDVTIAIEPGSIEVNEGSQISLTTRKLSDEEANEK